MLRGVLYAAVAAGLLVSTAAKADSVLLFAPSGLNHVDASAGNSSVGTVLGGQNYSNNGFSVTATGWGADGKSDGTSNPNILIYEKNAGGDEVGLGLNGQTDNEINAGQFIQFKITGVPAGATTLSFQAGSTNTFGETEESWSIYGSNVNGFYSGTALASCTNTTGSNCEQLIYIAAALGYTYIDVVANAGNVLIKEIDAVSTVPLPAALPLFATGLGGLGLLSWRRKRKAQAA